MFHCCLVSCGDKWFFSLDIVEYCGFSVHFPFAVCWGQCVLGPMTCLIIVYFGKAYL